MQTRSNMTRELGPHGGWLYCYYLDPKDHGWNFLLTVEEAAKKFIEEGFERGGEPDCNIKELNYFLDNYHAAKRLASENLWEGDFDGAAHVFALPDGSPYFQLAFVWKQHNNGSTFVVSPIELPWLEESEA